MLEEQKLREWEEKFDREQKIKEDQERLKEEKLKQLDLQQRKLRDQDYQNLSDEISTQLKDLDIKALLKINIIDWENNLLIHLLDKHLQYNNAVHHQRHMHL